MSHESQKQKNELCVEIYEVLPQVANNEHNHFNCNHTSVDLNVKMTAFNDCLQARVGDNYIQVFSNNEDKKKFDTENGNGGNLVTVSDVIYLQLISDDSMCQQEIEDDNKDMQVSTSEITQQGLRIFNRHFLKAASNDDNNSLQAKVSVNANFYNK